MRRADAVLTGFAVLSAVLLTLGALQLLDEVKPEERTGAWVRAALGLLFAVGAVTALGTKRWMLGAFAALLSAITPLAEGWAWAALPAIVIAVWAVIRVWNELTYDRKPTPPAP